MTNGSNDHPVIESNAPNGGWMERLKIRWGLNSLGQVIIILVVFSITGSTVVFLRKSLFAFLGFDENTSMWIKTTVYLLFVFPAYQILILFYGFLFGQFSFFWEKEKRMMAAIGRFIRREK